MPSPTPADDCALILCLAEEDRPADMRRRTLTGSPDSSAKLSKSRRGREHLHRAWTSLRTRRARPSAQVIGGGEAAYVMIAGVDSYLTAVRSRTTWRTPGSPCRKSQWLHSREAAAAVLCGAKPAGLDSQALASPGKQAFIYNPMDLPLRGDGITAAYRRALGEAALEMRALGYRIADLIRLSSIGSSNARLPICG